MHHLALMDPGLARVEGHRLAYAVDILRAARPVAVATSVWLSHVANEDVLHRLRNEAVEPNPVLMGARIYSLWQRAYRPIQFIRVVDQICAQAEDDDLICVVSGEIEQVAALMPYLSANPLGPRIVVQMFDWGPSTGAPPAERFVMGGFRRIANIWGRARMPSRLILAGQSTIAELLAARLQHRVPSLPFVIDWSRFSDETSDNPRKPTAVFLGSARAAKGFDHFVKATTQHDTGFYCKAQAFEIPGQAISGIGEYLDMLRAAKCEVYEQPLDDRSYCRLLQSADVVALPYSPQDYALRTSGILAEALGLGKVVVAPRGTWLGQTLERMNVGVTYEEYSPAGLARALRRARNELEEHRVRAAELAPKWRAEHNAHKFVQTLEDLRVHHRWYPAG